MAPRLAVVALFLLSLFLAGTVVVLSTVKVFFGVNTRDFISLDEFNYFKYANSVPLEVQPVFIQESRIAQSPVAIRNESAPTLKEVVPRIIHQTWKTDVVPERWESVRAQCQEMHPDYQHILWTDALSRQFIEEKYPWFLATFDGYKYPIQRADVIRYFVLDYYGGVYLDLDIGCRKPLDPLLHFPVVLPATIPVGVSNDFMVAAQGHPFLDQVIHHLVAFDHDYILPYATVMFSSGPMFLSAIYNLWSKKVSAVNHNMEVRILPKTLYGKNAGPNEALASLFWHYYGSSWHAEDAGFLIFLGTFGRLLMWLGAAVVALGVLRLIYSARRRKSSGPIALPFNPSSPCPPYSSDNESYFDVQPRISRAEAATLLRNQSAREAAKDPSQRGALYFLPLWHPTLSPAPTPGPSSNPASQSWASKLRSAIFDRHQDPQDSVSLHTISDLLPLLEQERERAHQNRPHSASASIHRSLPDGVKARTRTGRSSTLDLEAGHTLILPSDLFTPPSVKSAKSVKSARSVLEDSDSEDDEGTATPLPKYTPLVPHASSSASLTAKDSPT